MSQTDSNNFMPFIWVLGALVVFTFLIAILANMFSPAADRSSDPLVQEGIKKQIAPVGQSRVEPASDEAETAGAETATDEVELPAELATEEVAKVTEDPVANNTAAAAAVTASTAAVASTAAAVSTAVPVTDATAAALSAEVPLKVRAVVATNCAGCHQNSVKGAQRSDDSEAWSALAALGLDALTASVINGKGAMMPRAETSLSDDELGLAVQHMIAQAVGDGTGTGTGTGTPATSEEKPDADTAAETEAEPAAEAEKPATDDVASSAMAATTTESAAVPDNVKAVVDSLCAGCHISGVANAPKFGDKAAWDQRMSGGLDAILASAIAGKGAMPPRGGSQLNDAELRIAIEYMLTK